jgi:hypothetical protein
MEKVAEKIQEALERLAEALGLTQRAPQLQRIPVRVRDTRR